MKSRQIRASLIISQPPRSLCVADSCSSSTRDLNARPELPPSIAHKVQDKRVFFYFTRRVALQSQLPVTAFPIAGRLGRISPGRCRDRKQLGRKRDRQRARARWGRMPAVVFRPAFGREFARRGDRLAWRKGVAEKHAAETQAALPGPVCDVQRGFVSRNRAKLRPEMPILLRSRRRTCYVGRHENHRYS